MAKPPGQLQGVVNLIPGKADGAAAHVRPAEGGRGRFTEASRGCSIVTARQSPAQNLPATFRSACRPPVKLVPVLTTSADVRGTASAIGFGAPAGAEKVADIVRQPDQPLGTAHKPGVDGLSGSCAMSSLLEPAACVDMSECVKAL